ncbi:MAG TPA: hypothetical protein VNT42_11795 [Sphingomonas sp.]|nr:hypothetical protein [Sphingomonas sp.]
MIVAAVSLVILERGMADLDSPSRSWRDFAAPAQSVSRLTIKIIAVAILLDRS